MLSWLRRLLIGAPSTRRRFRSTTYVSYKLPDRELERVPKDEIGSRPIRTLVELSLGKGP